MTNLRYLDWVFLGTLKTSPVYPDIEKIKNVKSFDYLIEMGDTDFINMGVESQEVRSKILSSILTWNNEHQLPGFKDFNSSLLTDSNQQK